MDLELALKVLGAAVGLAGFGFGLYKYDWGQRWRRAEFVSEKVAEFEAKPNTRNAYWMLDYAVRQIDFSHLDGSDADANWIRVDRDMLAKALSPHAERSHFGPGLWQVRDTFEDFFDDLGRFQVFVDSGLFRHDHLRPYLNYWVRIIAGGDKTVIDKQSVAALWKFLAAYGYTDVKRLVEGFGYNARTLWDEARTP
jgi:hypothetical protein